MSCPKKKILGTTRSTFILELLLLLLVLIKLLFCMKKFSNFEILELQNEAVIRACSEVEFSNEEAIKACSEAAAKGI